MEKEPLTHRRLAPTVLLQLILLYAVVRPLGEGGDVGQRVRMSVWERGGGVKMEVERAQQGGGGLAAGGGGAAVGNGGMGSLEGSGVFKGGHRNGRPAPGLCGEKTESVEEKMILMGESS